MCHFQRRRILNLDVAPRSMCCFQRRRISNLDVAPRSMRCMLRCWSCLLWGWSKSKEWAEIELLSCKTIGLRKTLTDATQNSKYRKRASLKERKWEWGVPVNVTTRMPNREQEQVRLPPQGWNQGMNEAWVQLIARVELLDEMMDAEVNARKNPSQSWVKQTIQANEASRKEEFFHQHNRFFFSC